jgi:hypothetical protein
MNQHTAHNTIQLIYQVGGAVYIPDGWDSQQLVDTLTKGTAAAALADREFSDVFPAPQQQQAAAGGSGADSSHPAETIGAHQHILHISPLPLCTLVWCLTVTSWHYIRNPDILVMPYTALVT